jgi:thioredoxin-dependent peroxiredoxin
MAWSLGWPEAQRDRRPGVCERQTQRTMLLQLHFIMPVLQPGMIAPDFELPDAEGTAVRLSQFRGKKLVVVYFYPKDDTEICTKQACSFRDHYPQFERAGAVVMGISDDSVASHAKFRTKYGLPFLLLSDRGGRVRKLFGVAKKFGVVPGRVTFAIDREGVVRHVYSGLRESDQHVTEALGAL